MAHRRETPSHKAKDLSHWGEEQETLPSQNPHKYLFALMEEQRQKPSALKGKAGDSPSNNISFERSYHWGGGRKPSHHQSEARPKGRVEAKAVRIISDPGSCTDTKHRFTTTGWGEKTLS